MFTAGSCHRQQDTRNMTLIFFSISKCNPINKQNHGLFGYLSTCLKIVNMDCLLESLAYLLYFCLFASV
jgi:hypothetical protein